jgi:competence protein ComGC
MAVLLVALTDAERTLWYVTLALGLVVALVVAAMLLLLLSLLGRIQRGVRELLEAAGEVADNTANIPQLEHTAPVLEQIAAEGVVQDGYMNALSQGYAEEAR